MGHNCDIVLRNGRASPEGTEHVDQLSFPTFCPPPFSYLSSSYQGQEDQFVPESSSPFPPRTAVLFTVGSTLKTLLWSTEMQFRPVCDAQATESYGKVLCIFPPSSFPLWLCFLMERLALEKYSRRCLMHDSEIPMSNKLLKEHLSSSLM